MWYRSVHRIASIVRVKFLEVITIIILNFNFKIVVREITIFDGVRTLQVEWCDSFSMWFTLERPHYIIEWLKSQLINVIDFALFNYSASITRKLSFLKDFRSYMWSHNLLIMIDGGISKIYSIRSGLKCNQILIYWYVCVYARYMNFNTSISNEIFNIICLAP